MKGDMPPPKSIRDFILGDLRGRATGLSADKLVSRIAGLRVGTREEVQQELRRLLDRGEIKLGNNLNMVLATVPYAPWNDPAGMDAGVPTDLPLDALFPEEVSAEEAAKGGMSMKQRIVDAATTTERDKYTEPYHGMLPPDHGARVRKRLHEAAQAHPAAERGAERDMVVLPQHYGRFAIEPIRFIVENQLNWFQGNALKYFMRHDAKNGMEDIRKGIRYVLMYEQFLLGNYDWWRPYETWVKPSWCPEKWKEALL